MRILGKRSFGFFLVCLCVTFLASCTNSIRADVRGAAESELSGTFAVINYGCNFLDDLESIVLLDREGDRYTFEPNAPDFKYRIKKGLTSSEALAAAKNVQSCCSSCRDVRLSKIIAPSGELLGYEARPLHDSFSFSGDVLDVDYRITDDKVIVTIRIDSSVDKLKRDGDFRDRMR